MPSPTVRSHARLRCPPLAETSSWPDESVAIRSLCADETGTWHGWSVTLYADLMTMRIAIEALAEARSALESF